MYRTRTKLREEIQLQCNWTKSRTLMVEKKFLSGRKAAFFLNLETMNVLGEIRGTNSSKTH